jgi:hypothetical protein
MQTEAVFENIANHIKMEISKAQQSVFIADAWFDNKDLFKELIKKAKAGCKVLLIISEDCFNITPINTFSLLEKYYSKCYIIGDGEKELIYNKFCIIDYNTVITGSYNLNRKAESNFENIIISYNDTALAEQLISSFNKISRHFYKAESNFITENKQLTSWDDPEIAALQLEVKILENHLNVYENERIELEKLLSDFHHRHTIELGDIILEILKLRKLKYRKYSKKHEEAEEDYKQYSKQIKDEKKKTRFELADEEMVELKKRFRKAIFMCHPDKVGDKFKNSAQTIFVELKTAYEANDLTRVTEILNNLEKGSYFKSLSDTISKKDKLLAASAKLHIQIKTLESEIFTIRLSETFKTILNIDDWDTYFKKTRELLEHELQELRVEIDKQINNLLKYE